MILVAKGPEKEDCLIKLGCWQGSNSVVYRASVGNFPVRSYLIKRMSITDNERLQNKEQMWEGSTVRLGPELRMS